MKKILYIISMVAALVAISCNSGSTPKEAKQDVDTANASAFLLIDSVINPEVIQLYDTLGKIQGSGYYFDCQTYGGWYQISLHETIMAYKKYDTPEKIQRILEESFRPSMRKKAQNALESADSIIREKQRIFNKSKEVADCWIDTIISHAPKFSRYESRENGEEKTCQSISFEKYKNGFSTNKHDDKDPVRKAMRYNSHNYLFYDYINNDSESELRLVYHAAKKICEQNQLEAFDSLGIYKIVDQITAGRKAERAHVNYVYKNIKTDKNKGLIGDFEELLDTYGDEHANQSHVHGERIFIPATTKEMTKIDAQFKRLAHQYLLAHLNMPFFVCENPFEVKWINDERDYVPFLLLGDYSTNSKGQYSSDHPANNSRIFFCRTYMTPKGMYILLLHSRGTAVMPKDWKTRNQVNMDYKKK